jgi:hypothetical protein
MTLRGLLVLCTAVMVVSSALAQFTRSQKNEVLSEVDRILTKQAFVPGVDLVKWRDFISERKERLGAAETPSEFADIVNGAFRQFGFSHIQLEPDRRRWRGGDELSALQGRRSGRLPGFRWVDEETALVRIPAFTGGYDEDAVEEIFDSIESAKYLIVDLRGNPGGEVENMRHFLGLLLPSDTSIGTFVSKNIADAYVEAGNTKASDPIAIAKWAHKEFRPRRSTPGPFKGGIAVLVDGGSASASEIIANALREAKKSPIIGTPSAGAVLVSTYDRLSYGFRMQYPVGDYVSAGGIRLEGHPITPDVRASDRDAIDSAVSRLKGLSYWINRQRITG